MGWAYLGIVVCVATFCLTPIKVDKGIKYTQTLSKVTVVSKNTEREILHMIQVKLCLCKILNMKKLKWYLKI